MTEQNTFVFYLCINGILTDIILPNMRQLKFVKLILPYLFLAGVLSFSYHYFLKDFYWNNTKQTLKIDSSLLNQTLKLQKHAAQNNIQALEIEIKGTSKENITVLFSTSKEHVTWQISLKKGEIDFSNSIDWTADSCFITIQTRNARSSNLRLDYQFIGKNGHKKIYFNRK